MSGDVQVRFCERLRVQFPWATHLVLGFERPEDAERVLKVLHLRMAKYRLTLHPEKTRLIPFAVCKDGASGTTRSGTFDFLGFTMYRCRTRWGGWRLGMKTRKARLRKAITALRDHCRRHRHQSRAKQHAALVRRLRGHYQYFGVNGNIRSLRHLLHAVTREWLKWLRRRSQRARRLTWERFHAYLSAFPLPTPRIYVSIWERAS